MISIASIESVDDQPEPGSSSTAMQNLQVKVPIEGAADMAVHQVGDQCVIVMTAPVTQADCEAAVAGVKTQLEASKGALSSHMRALKMDEALEALASRS